MKADDRQLDEWIAQLNSGMLVLPRFQRMEAWGNREVTDLMQMVVRGLPIGAVLILKVGDSVPFKSRPLETAPAAAAHIAELLLDGQQRLTAIWRCLHNTYADRTYYLQFPQAGSSSREYQVVSHARWRKNGANYPIWADSPKECWARRLLPMQLLRPGSQAEVDATEWAGEVSGGNVTAQMTLMLEITKIRFQVQSFNLPYLSLDVGTSRDVVLDVFVKMNTRSVNLTAFDIVVAQTEEETGESLHALVDNLKFSVPRLEKFDSLSDVALNSMALLQDRVPNETGYLSLDLAKMVQDWPLLVAGAKEAVGFLEQEKVFDRERLPTESILAPLVALWANAPKQPDKKGNARILLQKYLWRSFFTDRYERAAATAALQDYRALRNVLQGTGDTSAVPCLNESLHPLPTIEALVQAGWPRKRDRLARAILLLSLRGQALDISDGKELTRESIAEREYHHLFPIAFLNSRGIDEGGASRALNCALINWQTNRAISDKEPVKYLRERTKTSTLGEDEVRRRLKTHGIAYEDLANCEFEDFLQHRAELVSSGMTKLCAGIAWAPPA